MTPHIYYLRATGKILNPAKYFKSFDDYIEKDHPRLEAILAGEIADNDKKRVRLKLPKTFKAQDYFATPDFQAMFSAELVEFLEAVVKKDFRKAGIYLNDSLYYMINTIERNCLDQKKSKYSFLGKKPKLLWVDKYRLLKTKIPEFSLFSIKYTGNHLMCTESLKKQLEKTEFQGLSFLDVEKPGGIWQDTF
jgi:hypothetical protein